MHIASTNMVYTYFALTPPTTNAWRLVVVDVLSFVRRDPDCPPTAPFRSPNPPLAFDLGVDVGEAYALNASEPVTPASTGALSFDTAVTAASTVAENHRQALVWGPTPMLNHGPFDPALWPCAQPGCKPFPQCCMTT